MTKPKFRRPQPNEQRILDHLTLRPFSPHERRRYQALMEKHHYLHRHQLVGEELCYVASYRGEWLGLSSWCACARRLKAREVFIAWPPEQCRRRRAKPTTCTPKSKPSAACGPSAPGAKNPRRPGLREPD
jgi:hypothetical protein